MVCGCGSSLFVWRVLLLLIELGASKFCGLVVTDF